MWYISSDIKDIKDIKDVTVTRSYHYGDAVNRKLE